MSNLQDRKDQINKIIKLLKNKYPNCKLALNFTNPLELLIATILAAQCTDEKVNHVTDKLFKKYTSVKDYAAANLKILEQEIKPTGFYRNKAKNIIATAKKIIEEFNGKVPNRMKDLVTLPGVARKTANIVLSWGYNKIEGIVVDTHVRRLSQRLGLTQHDEPLKIEEDLMELLPKSEWPLFSVLLMEHGRMVCQAKKPLCNNCVLHTLCPSRSSPI